MPAYRRAGWNRRDSGVRRATLREDNALEAHCAYRYVGIAQTAYLRAGSRQAAGIRQGAGVAAGARRRLGAWAIEDLRTVFKRVCRVMDHPAPTGDRKSTRLNSSH